MTTCFHFFADILPHWHLGYPGGSWYTTTRAPRPGPGHEKPRKTNEKRRKTSDKIIFLFIFFDFFAIFSYFFLARGRPRNSPTRHGRLRSRVCRMGGCLEHWRGRWTQEHASQNRCTQVSDLARTVPGEPQAAGLDDRTQLRAAAGPRATAAQRPGRLSHP